MEVKIVPSGWEKKSCVENTKRKSTYFDRNVDVILREKLVSIIHEKKGSSREKKFRVRHNGCQQEDIHPSFLLLLMKIILMQTKETLQESIPRWLDLSIPRYCLLK